MATSATHCGAALLIDLSNPRVCPGAHIAVLEGGHEEVVTRGGGQDGELGQAALDELLAGLVGPCWPEALDEGSYKFLSCMLHVKDMWGVDMTKAAVPDCQACAPPTKHAAFSPCNVGVTNPNCVAQQKTKFETSERAWSLS